MEVAIEINVSYYGYYRVEVPYVLNPLNYSYYTWVSKDGYLSIGLQWLNVSFYGPKIYVDKLDVSALGEIRLYKDYGTLIDNILYVPLFKVYYYTDFDCRAVLTGKVYDEGVDTDADGLFDYLEVGVEVNVTEAGTYQISVWGTCRETGWCCHWYYLNIRSDLNKGIHIINFTFPGPMIAYYHINPTNVSDLTLGETPIIS